MRITRILMIMFTFLALGSLILALLIMRSDGIIAREQSRRYISYRLADELRQTSDDLTRMTRAYAATSDIRFSEYAKQIRDIRSGAHPRPEDYHTIYWDYYVAAKEPPRPSGDPIALRKMMQEEGFTNEEFGLMQNSETNAVDLQKTIEREAIEAVGGRFKDETGQYTVEGEPDMEAARRLLYSDEYHDRKADVMRPIEKFLVAVDKRTAASVAAQERIRGMLELPLILAIAAAVLLGIVSIVRMGRFIVLLERKEKEEEERLQREQRIAERRAEREKEESRPSE